MGNKYIDNKYKHSEITAQVIGCAMKVRGTLGNGFQEVIYQRCLAIEMEKVKLSFAREFEMSIIYEGIDVGTRRVDFFVENRVMVEIKAIAQLEEIHMAQAINYLEVYKIETGLLLNFGGKSLQFKRLVAGNKLIKNVY
jgi:GxxExxY protein